MIESYLPDSDVPVGASGQQQALVGTEPDDFLKRILRVQVWLHLS